MQSAIEIRSVVFCTQNLGRVIFLELLIPMRIIQTMLFNINNYRIRYENYLENRESFEQPSVLLKSFILLPKINEEDNVHKMITHTVSYENVLGNHKDLLSANHCQKGSNFLVYTVVTSTDGFREEQVEQITRDPERAHVFKMNIAPALVELHLELQRDQTPEEDKEHFEVAGEIEKMILQGAKEGDLVENLAESGYRTSGVFILQKDSKGKLLINNLDTMMDDYGHVGEGFSLGPEYPVGYWNKAEFERAYWHSNPNPTMEPVHKDILLELKLGDFAVMGDYSVASFEWGALKFPGSPEEVLRKIKKLLLEYDIAYFENGEINEYQSDEVEESEDEDEDE